MVQAAEEAAALEARRLKEEEEYAAWKGEMAMEGGGSAAAEAEAESAGLLGAFEGYIKVMRARRVVSLGIFFLDPLFGDTA